MKSGGYSIAKLSSLKNLLFATKAPNTSVTSREKEFFLILLLFACSFIVVRLHPFIQSPRFSNIIAYSALPRFATGARENSRNKVASFQRLASANISSGVSMQFQRQLATCQVERSSLIWSEGALSSRVSVINSCERKKATIDWPLIYSNCSHLLCKNLNL